MKLKLIFVLILILFNIGLVMSQSNWNDYSIDNELRIPVRDSMDWSYPWYVIKHSDGDFENTMSDSISYVDTVKLVHNSKCYSFIKYSENERFSIDTDEANSRLKFTMGRKLDDTLSIKIFDISASNNEIVELSIVGEKYQLEYKTGYVFPYEKILIEYVDQSLTINESLIYVGENITGYLNMEMIETILYKSGKKSKPKYKRIRGSFEAKIK